MTEKKPAQKPKQSNILVRLLALLVTTALVLGALALVVYRDQLNLDALKRWLSYRSLETGETGEAVPFTHAGGDKLAVAYLENGILLSSATGAHYYSFSGDKYAEEVLSMDNPVLAASAKAGVVYDAGGQSLFLFRGTEEVFDLSLEGGADLLSARVNDNGWLAVTAQQSGYKGAVTVYDNHGKKIIQISLSSTFVVDAALSPDCETVAVVTMDQEAGAFQSSVLFYPVDQKEPSAVCSLGSATVLDLDYEKDTLWILGESQLMTVVPETDQLQTYLFGRSFLKGCDFGGEGFALLLLGRYRAGSADQALILGPDGAASATMELGSQVLSYGSAGDYCSLLTGSSLMVYTKDLQPYATLTSTQGARYTDLGDDASALLVNAQQAWLYIPE